MILTEAEVLFVKESYENGVTNPISIVSLLYSKGNNQPYTKLKKDVITVLGLRETYRSVSSGEKIEK